MSDEFVILSKILAVMVIFALVVSLAYVVCLSVISMLIDNIIIAPALVSIGALAVYFWSMKYGRS
jgi:hypothetical protein